MCVSEYDHVSLFFLLPLLLQLRKSENTMKVYVDVAIFLALPHYDD